MTAEDITHVFLLKIVNRYKLADSKGAREQEVSFFFFL